MQTMLQIRLNKDSSADGAGGGPSAAKSSLPGETVTVACPDHLVLADLPVAKSLGAVTSSAVASVRSIGRRSRRSLGQKVHFCVRCDFPVAIYGRLTPCDHAFCLACARSDSCCYLCEERIQKIQTIKMMEGIFVCAAPHCLKSYLKRSEFESHVNETHADLLHPNAEREGGHETDAINTTRQSSADLYKQSLQPESSTAHAPSRPGFSPSSSMQPLDREERSRRHQSRDQPTPRPPLQPRPPSYQNRPQQQPGDHQADNHPPQGSDRPSNWLHQSQNNENQSGPQQWRDADQISQEKQTGTPEHSFSSQPPHPPQPPNYPHPLSANPALVSAPFSFPPFQADGPHPYYTLPFEMPRSGLVSENGLEQGSVLGVPSAPTGIASFSDNVPRPWGMAFMGVQFPPMQLGQGVPNGFTNLADPQGGIQFFQGSDYGRIQEGLPMNPPLPGKELELQGGSAEHSDGKTVMAQLPIVVPAPLPPPPPPHSLQPPQLNGSTLSSGGFGQEGQTYSWQSE